VASLPALPPSLSAGLQPGDTILAVEDQPTPDYASFYTALESLPVMPQVEYRVERGGSEATVSGAWPFPVLISSVSPASAAMDARLRVGDVILATDGVPLTAFSQLQERVAAGEGAPMALTIWRNGETLDLTLAPRRTDLPRPEGGFETRWLIGLTGALVFEPQTERIGPGTALLNGGEQVYVLIRSSLSALGHVVTGAISSCNLRGPIGIAEASGQMASQGLVAFIWFVAVLSTAVGFLNLFPIPVLDGGHLVFHAYEAVMRRPPSEKALRVLMVIGLSILLGFMVFALSNDLTCP
jgi:regulator of sigma E protease